VPFHDPHGAVQFVAQTSLQVLLWPELPQPSSDARSVNWVCGAFVELVRPCSAGYGYEVGPGWMAALLERLEQARACMDSVSTSKSLRPDPGNHDGSDAEGQAEYRQSHNHEIPRRPMREQHREVKTMQRVEENPLPPP
jgi:hypothetical protein